MKRLIIALVGMLLAPSLALAWNRIPDTGTVKVIYLLSRNAPITIPTGGQGFYFSLDASFNLSSLGLAGCSGVTSISTFFVPKADPAALTTDNPAYRDIVNSLMLAQALARPTAVYIDSCVNGYPRVVGFDVL